MDADNCELASRLVPSAYIRQGQQSLGSRHRRVKALLSCRRMPEKGWDEATIELFLRDLALMDSNNFPGNVGVGEREARVASGIVARRHFGLAHGIGRSGDITAHQPKAAGSSLLARLTDVLAADALRVAGLPELSSALVLPVATGMALTLTLLALAAGANARPAPAAVAACHADAAGDSGSAPAAAGATAGDRGAAAGSTISFGGATAGAPAAAGEAAGSGGAGGRRYVVWSRVDQKTCLKCIAAANLTPVVVELRRDGDELATDLAGMEAAVAHAGPAHVAAVVTTTSCFAPRRPDDVVAVAKMCARLGVPHVVNNAYGLGCAATRRALAAALRNGRVDAVVHSTDKNFMVPVGGALLAAPRAPPPLAAQQAGGGGGGHGGGGGGSVGDGGGVLDAVARAYPGRAAAGAHVDLLITLLGWGADGWRRLLLQREEVMEYMRCELQRCAAAQGERLLSTPSNPISLAITLDTLEHAPGPHSSRHTIPTPASTPPTPPAPNTSSCGSEVSCGGGNAADAGTGRGESTGTLAGAAAITASSIETARTSTAAESNGVASNFGSMDGTISEPPVVSSTPLTGTGSHVGAANTAPAVSSPVSSLLSAPVSAPVSSRVLAEGVEDVLDDPPRGPETAVVSPTSPAAPRRCDVTFFGAMLWSRGVSGTRVVPRDKPQTVAGVRFSAYGAHCNSYPHAYFTAAAALGTTQEDVDEFVRRLGGCFKEFRTKALKGNTKLT